MFGASVFRRRVLFLVALCTIHVFAWTSILYSIRTTKTASSQQRSEVKSAYPDYFETYVNYSGPQPLPRPIDLPSSFRFVINEPETCGAERHPGMRVLHYVHSAPHHLRQREFIRRTWASPKFYAQFKMATVFFLGRTSNGTLQALIEGESARFKDVIQADFPDEYYRLTYKAASALAWISQFCSHAEHVVKTDDDVFVNAFRLTKMLFGKGNRSDDDIHCYGYFNAVPFRNGDSKWCVNEEEYPWNKYPDFCAGLAFYFAGHLVPKLYGAMPNVPYVKIDDVYVTGMLRRHARIGIDHLGDQVNVFSGNICLQKAPEPEVFCLVNSVALSEKLWLQLLTMEIKERATKSERDWLKYSKALSDILNRDWQ